MFVLPEEEADVPPHGCFGAAVAGRTVADMSTFHALTTVVASHGEHDHFWFPFAFLWLFLVGVLIWCFVGRRRWYRYPSGPERASDILAERFARGEITGEEYRERLEQ